MNAFNLIFQRSSSRNYSYIKDYEGATLMGCELNLKVPYTEFSLVTKKQKEILKLIIQKKQAEITEKVCKLCKSYESAPYVSA